MAMSGYATEAYAFLLHAVNTCNLLDGNKTGRVDLGYFANKLRDAYAELRRDVRDLYTGQRKTDVPNLEVALFGWSWRHLAFEGYRYTYEPSGELGMHRINLAIDRSYPYHLMGDVASDAATRLRQLMTSRAFPRPMRGDPNARDVAAKAFLDWEPLEVLIEMIDDKEVRSVGGVPQVARLYQYGECESFVWRTSDGNDYFGGRPVQSTERFDRRIMTFADRKVEISFSDRSIYFGGDGGD
jgi:hypothetical protein